MNLGTYLMHDSMTLTCIQGQGQDHGVYKFVKMPISESVSSTGMHVIKRLMVNYDTPRQNLLT